MANTKNVNLVSYFGGKWQILDWLIPLFPLGEYHFIDCFCGSGNVGLNVNYPLVTMNDINSDVYNLFMVLRNNKEELLEKLYFTPFSREECEACVNMDNENISAVEKARSFYVRCQIGYGANGSQNKHKGVGFEWEIQKKRFYKVNNWNLRLEKLPDIIDRLRHIQITKMDFFDLYKRQNKKGNILYLDPPYVLSTRKSKKRYKHETDDKFHFKLLEIIQDSRAFIALSGYSNDLYNGALSDWYVNEKTTKSNTSSTIRTEVLYTNYDPQTINGQINLF